MRIAIPLWLRRRKALRLLFSIVLLPLALSACQAFGNERLIYDQQGMQVGLQTDPSVRRSSPPALNAHPAQLTSQEVLVLLGAVRVSGWSGTIVGLFGAPRAIPLFDDGDLRVIAMPIADAFRQAGPTERVFFNLPNPASAYGDATAGALFMRGSSLHLIVTDHKAFARADTAGGDEKDARDTKGMKLGVAYPYRPAALPASDEPDWAPFETVHLSLKVKELLAQESQNVAASGTKSQAGTTPTGSGAAVTAAPAESTQDLRLQIRELTQSNLDLRDRSNQQMQELRELKEELARLRRELGGAKRKTPETRKPSTP